MTVLKQRIQIEENKKMPVCNWTQAAEPYSVWEGKNWMLCETLIHGWSKELQGRTLEGTQTEPDNILRFMQTREASGPTWEN